MFIHFPVKNTKVSQPFDFDNTNHPERSSFYTLFDNKHPGVDFPTSVGTEVFASFKGVVVRREHHEGMGKVLALRNGNIVALYAHLKEFSVSLGEVVVMGQLIGSSGSTGSTCIEPHLHFELRDISKKSLKDMVFAPLFESECTAYLKVFKYIVNNENTLKSLASLSKLYFGTTNYWESISKANSLKVSSDAALKNGLNLLIPNY